MPGWPRATRWQRWSATPSWRWRGRWPSASAARTWQGTGWLDTSTALGRAGSLTKRRRVAYGGDDPASDGVELRRGDRQAQGSPDGVLLGGVVPALPRHGAGDRGAGPGVEGLGEPREGQRGRQPAAGCTLRHPLDPYHPLHEGRRGPRPGHRRGAQVSVEEEAGHPRLSRPP